MMVGLEMLAGLEHSLRVAQRFVCNRWVGFDGLQGGCDLGGGMVCLGCKERRKMVSEAAAQPVGHSGTGLVISLSMMFSRCMVTSHSRAVSQRGT